jgi:tripartite-type tricarboxylate transporter receptor subunit TctC
MAEAGLAGFSVLGWNGLMAPKGTPPTIIGKLNSAVQRGLDDGELRQRLVAAGYEPAATQFARRLRALHPRRHREMGRPGGKDQYEGH